MDHGVFTGAMGKRLYQKYADTVHQIYYDHGKDAKAEPHYCKPTPFIGECSRATTLSCVDIVVVNSDSKQVELIAEIEESGHEPKKLIGDIWNLVLADQVRVQAQDYGMADVVLVLGLRINPHGKGKDKAEKICEILKKQSWQLRRRKLNIVPLVGDELEMLIACVEDEIDQRLLAL